MDKNNWKRSPWTISIVTAIFSLLLTMGYDYFKDIPILTTISSFFKWICGFVLTSLNYEIKIYWLLLAIVVICFVLYIMVKFNKEDTSKPHFFGYNEDSFKNWRWTWEWKFNHSRNAWGIYNLKAHCPKCDTTMNDNSTIMGLNFICPRCDYNAYDSICEDPYKVESIIIDNVDRRTNELKKK
jgi:hypothetical protein